MVKDKRIMLSLKSRIIIFFLCSLLLMASSYLFISIHFITNSIHNLLNNSYETLLEEIYEKVSSTLWSLTLTSQQLLENKTLLTAMDNYLHTTNHYMKSEYYEQFIEVLYSLTMTNTDVNLISFYLTDNANPIYSTFPSNNDLGNVSALFQNQEFTFLGPSTSQSKALGIPVLSLNRSGVLPDETPITLSLESGLYSFSSLLKSVHDNSAYLVFTNYQGDFIYNTLPEEYNSTQSLKNIVLDSNLGYHIFSKKSPQEWTLYIIVPNDIYTLNYDKYLTDFILFTSLIGALCLFAALIFWKSIYQPLHMLNLQLNKLLTDEISANEIHSSIPEYNLLLNKISLLQHLIQEMIHSKVVQEREHSKMQLEKLRAQVNPHFLLNTLNTLHWMALMEHQTDIDGQVQSLSRLLSYNLTKDTSYTNLTKEIAAIKEYVNLQKVRYNFEFHIETSVAPFELNYPCPKFILQPLVENALLHGYRSGMDIILTIRIDNEIEIEVKDTGTGMNIETCDKLQVLSKMHSSTLQPDMRSMTLSTSPTDTVHFGIGLQYVIQSLDDFSQGNYHFSVQSTLGDGTNIKLVIPKIKGEGYYAKSPDY